MVMLMLEKDAAVGRVFNCGHGTKTRIDELAQTIISLYGKDSIKPELRQERPGDITHSYANIAFAKDTLGYRPKVDLAHGLKEIVDLKLRTSDIER
jgi:nucleoside-diphosphate-sugar epimerase